MAVDKKVTKATAVAAKKPGPKISKSKRIILSKIRKATAIKLNAGKKKPALQLKPGTKERKGKELRKKTHRHYLLTGKFQPPHTIRVNKQVFLGNLSKTTTEKDIMESLTRFHRYITSVRVLRSTGTGKKVQKDADGKKLMPSRGGAFIRLRTLVSRQNLLKMKDLKIGGRKIRLSKATPKKAHGSMLVQHKKNKLAAFKKITAEKKVVKEKMQANMIKNQKHVKNLKKNLRRKKTSKSDGKSKAGEKLTPAQRKNKTLLEKSKRKVTIESGNERRRLSGYKARKAMARRTRK